jgi:protein-L-isoaspartate(D-aspartate) O-methyltransferase
MKLFIPVCISLLLVSCLGVNSITPSPAIPSREPTPEITETAEYRDDPYLDERLDMVENDIEARGLSNQDVLDAMRSVPRHKFVPQEFVELAYSDHPLPIGYGQTISQPYMVALMTELLELSENDKVLEIGTGSGYQAAVLSELGYVEVYSIEIINDLAASARSRLLDTGYERTHIIQGDGYFGWEEQAPFDAIIVTAAPDHLPQPLANQLAEGGRMVIPIGPLGGFQTLWVFEKEGSDLTAKNMGLVTFVPFTGSGIESGYPAP